jgi:ABC-type transport system involved in Fe-S cluster assembly fused permease/ATPase subunit
MDDVVNVVKDANTHDFITKLPDGYESQVSCLFLIKKYY